MRPRSIGALDGHVARIASLTARHGVSRIAVPPQGARTPRPAGGEGSTMGRAEDPARMGAIADLPARLRRAVAGLHDADDLAATLDHLLAVVGDGTAIERLVLAVDRGEVDELASSSSSADRHEAAPVAGLVREVTARGAPVAASCEGEGPAGGHGDERCRYAVPVVAAETTLAVLVAEPARGTGLETADEVAVESIATLLAPLLLVRRQLADVRELDRLRSDFIARVSHELRTPLTIITGFAGTLGAHEDGLTVEQRHAMLDRIVTASIRLEHLIEEVLSLASVDAGLAEPEPQLVPVRDVVDLAVHDRGGTARVEVQGGERLRVHTDPEVARFVLGALVENALQQGDLVRVEIEPVGAAVRVAVVDDGPGVPAELGHRIFERFVRGDDRSPGMGLGLAIARRMGEMIDARLWFEEVDRGARFVAELPAQRPGLQGRQSP